MGKVFFTVFTPIYNRKHTIHRVWDSLKIQTNKNFEWLIIDDGSEDGVEELLESYRLEADFKVRIIYQKNSGKHIAFNKAIDEAKGELFIPADSDDSFISTTIELFEMYWRKYENDRISGVDVLCMNTEGKVIGDKFPKEGISTFFDIYYRNKVKGEKWGCIRTDILKQYKFPEMFGASFFPEGYLWSQIGLNYKTVYINIPLRVYHQDAGNQLMKINHNSIGAKKISLFYNLWWINTIYPVVKDSLSYIEVLKRFLSLWKYTFKLKESSFITIEKLKSNKNKILAILTFLPAYVYVKVLKKD